MATIVELVQGSPEWLVHRANHRNASETPAVLGVSPWVTPFMLWEQRTGRRQQASNLPMRRGTQLEPAARAAYERLTGNVMQPLVLVEGDYSCSLDGMTLDGSLIVEIKAPYKGKASSFWQSVEAGEIPEHYRWQIEHQLMVADAQIAHLFVFDGTEGMLLEMTPTLANQARIHEAWEAFMPYLSRDEPPPLTEHDTRQRTDPSWREAASRYIEVKRQADAAQAAADEAKAKLIALASHPIESGAGVSVTRYWKRGAVDYKKVPALAGVDLESFRKETRLEVRVSVV